MKKDFACFRHMKNRKCPICLQVGGLDNFNFSPEIKRFLMNSGYRNKNWEIICDWTGIGSGNMLNAYNASNIIRCILSHSKITKGKVMSESDFNQLDKRMRGLIMRILGSYERKPKDRVLSILEGYAALLQRNFPGVHERAVFYTVPVAPFRMSKLSEREKLVFSCETYFSELDAEECLLCTTKGRQYYCTALHYYSGLTMRKRAAIVAENSIEYELDFDKFNSRFRRQNKDKMLTGSDVLEAYELRSCELQRTLHYQQLMRVLRIKDWMTETPIWMALDTVFHIEMMYKNDDYQKWVNSGAKTFKSNWFMSPMMLRYFVSLSTIEDEKEYYRTKDLIRNNFTVGIKAYDIMPDESVVSDKDIKKIRDIVLKRAEVDNDGLGLEMYGSCPICERNAAVQKVITNALKQ